MSHHKIRITDGNGRTVEIKTEPECFDIKQIEDRGAHLCIGWFKDDLARSPREYLAVTETWPGRETVELTDEDGYEVVFSGTLVSSGYDRRLVCLAAHEESGS
jgi:hypothetical protein